MAYEIEAPIPIPLGHITPARWPLPPFPPGKIVSTLSPFWIYTFST